MDPLSITIVGGLIAGLGVAATLAAARNSPSIMAAVRRYFIGLDFLVVGRPRSGKTSFYNYLRFDRLADEHPTKRTRRLSDKWAFDVDRGGDIKLRIKSAFDIPGELPPSDQAKLITRRAPQVLIVFVSAHDDGAIPWLREFLQSLSLELSTEVQLIKRLRSLTIVANKTDLVDDDAVEAVLEEARGEVTASLFSVLGRNERLVDVLPCSLLRSAGGEKAGNNVVLTVVEALKATRRLVL